MYEISRGGETGDENDDGDNKIEYSSENTLYTNIGKLPLTNIIFNARYTS